MFVHASSSSAVRPVPRPASAAVPDLDLPSAGGACPTDEEELAHKVSAFLLPEEYLAGFKMPGGSARKGFFWEVA